MYKTSNKAYNFIFILERRNYNIYIYIYKFEAYRSTIINSILFIYCLGYGTSVYIYKCFFFVVNYI